MPQKNKWHRLQNLRNVIVVFTLIVSACNTSLPQTESTTGAIPTQTQNAAPTLKPLQTQVNLPQTDAEVPRVSVADAKAAFDNGKAIIVDVRGPQSFEESHIKGAIYVAIPQGEFVKSIPNMPFEKDQWIITYCT